MPTYSALHYAAKSEAYSVNSLNYANESKSYRDQAIDAVIPSVITKSGYAFTLEDQKVYSLSTVGSNVNLSFNLPTVTDTTKIHQIKAMLKISNLGVSSVNWGTTHIYNEEMPEILANRCYAIYWDYDNNLNSWVVGGMIIS